MVVLLGSDENVYGFAKSFNKHYGVKPIALATLILDATKYSKIVDIIVDPRLHDEEHLILELINLAKKLKKEYKKLILIPCSDSYLEMVIKNQDSLGDYENKYISYDHLKEFNDKVSFYKMCDKYNLPYPKSYVFDKKNYEKIVKTVDLDYPVILKPNNSNSIDYLDAEFPGKEKVYFIDNKEQLLETIKNIYSSTYNDTLIIQKYVNGDDTNTRVLNVYCDKKGKVRMMGLGQPILEEYHPKTFGNYAAIISRTEHIDLMDDLKKFLEDIHYTGVANFDIKMDSKTGKYYLFEINPRPGRSNAFTAAAGNPLAKYYVDDLVYDKTELSLDNKEEVLWINVPFVLIKKYVKNEDVLKKVYKLKKEKKIVQTLKCEDDNSLKRQFVVELQYARKIHYYPKYYIDKK